MISATILGVARGATQLASGEWSNSREVCATRDGLGRGLYFRNDLD